MRKPAIWTVGLSLAAAALIAIGFLVFSAGKTGPHNDTDAAVKREVSPAAVEPTKVDLPPSAIGQQGERSTKSAEKAVPKAWAREYALEDLYEAIQHASKGQEVTDVVKQQTAAFQNAGFDPAAGLRELYDRDGSVQERTIILLTLQEVGTPQALAALKEIAMKPGNADSTLGPRAIRALATLTKDPDQISELLVSESPMARDTAGSALLGKELTEVSVRRLGELLRSDVSGQHCSVGSAFATDRSTKTVDLKVDLLLAALPQLERLKDGTQTYQKMGLTGRDEALNSYTFALSEMLGADDVLQKRFASSAASTMEHKVLSIALALRKNKAAYPGVLQIAQSEKNGFERCMAVRGLGFVGSAGDIEFLKGLTANDPYTRLSGGRNAGETIYPVRLAAKNAIEQLRKQASTVP